MKSKFLLIISTAILLIIIGFLLLTQSDRTEQQIFKSTYDASKEYLSLRNRTDNILVNAKSYVDYSSWSRSMAALIHDWEALENKLELLEGSAGKQAKVAAINLQLAHAAYAYSAKEVSNIYDKAPKFKGIATLANHLGVDAKRAQVILNKAQAEISVDVFTEEGDAFKTLENTAIVVKDGCKVVGFVGGAVLTGGAAGLVTTVVVGADLALEVTEDGTQIAFGDRNKVSSFVGRVRTVTEPIASVLTITNISNNLGNAFGRFDSVMVGLEQFRESVQEGKVIGIDLTNFEYHRPFERIRKAKYPQTVSAAAMEMAEVESWLQSLNKQLVPMTSEEVKEFLSNSPKEAEPDKEVKEEVKTKETENKKEATTNNTGNIPNQIIRVKNVSGSSWMIDTCFSAACWDNLAAKPEEDIDLGGIYTLGKVFGPDQGFSKQFQVAQMREGGQLVETAPNNYKISLYFAIAPFEGTKNKTIDYGTWLSHSIEVGAKYGDEPVIEWNGTTLKQSK